MKKMLFIGLSLELLNINLLSASRKNLLLLKNEFAQTYQLSKDNMDNLVSNLRKFKIDENDFFKSKSSTYHIQHILLLPNNKTCDGMINISTKNVFLNFLNCPRFTSNYDLINTNYFDNKENNLTKPINTKSRADSTQKKSNMKIYLAGGAAVTAACIGGFCYFYPEQTKTTAASLWDALVKNSKYYFYKYFSSEPWKASLYKTLSFKK